MVVDQFRTIWPKGTDLTGLGKPANVSEDVTICGSEREWFVVETNDLCVSTAANSWLLQIRLLPVNLGVAFTGKGHSVLSL
jgi:hypothetical protein